MSLILLDATQSISTIDVIQVIANIAVVIGAIYGFYSWSQQKKVSIKLDVLDKLLSANIESRDIQLNIIYLLQGAENVEIKRKRYSDLMNYMSENIKLNSLMEAMIIKGKAVEINFSDDIFKKRNEIYKDFHNMIADFFTEKGKKSYKEIKEFEHRIGDINNKIINEIQSLYKNIFRRKFIKIIQKIENP